MVIKSCPLLVKDTETCVGSSLASYFVLFSLISLVSFYFIFISLISFRFVSFLLISFRFRWFRFVSFLFRFALYRYPKFIIFFCFFLNYYINLFFCQMDSAVFMIFFMLNFIQTFFPHNTIFCLFRALILLVWVNNNKIFKEILKKM
jgi:hypothetical protein